MSTIKLPRRAVHLDFHTMPGVHDVGRDFDAGEFVRTLKEAGVDYVTTFAKCNIGFAYYPTKVGTVHPGLEIDLLGSIVEACHREGIRVGAYFNVGIDHEHALRHREWSKVDEEGRVYKFGEMGHFFRNLCFNTGYGDYLLGMVDEVLANYPVDGIFLDCFDLSSCYGVECLEGMKKLGMDVLDECCAREYAKIVTGEFMQRTGDLVRRSKPDALLYFNSSIPFSRQPTHIEIEVLPSGGWGYDFLPFAIRYARTLGKPYLTMTGRFPESWGDFGGIRTEHSLLFDCYNSVANGGACSIGDHLHPRGRLEPEVYRMIGRVYEKLQALDPWTEGAVPMADVVVVHPRLREFPGNPTLNEYIAGKSPLSAVQGAARMLSELKVQFDVSDGEGDLSAYSVVVLPDNVPVSGLLKTQLEEHVARGGAIISSATAGMTPEQDGFALTTYDIAYNGPEPSNVTYLLPESEVGADMPDMLAGIHIPGISMSQQGGSKVLARLFGPYFNKGEWDGYHENLYIPPDADSGRPALVRCGNVFHFSFPIFTDYSEHALIAHRTLLRNCLEIALPQPLVRTANMPSFGQATVCGKGDSRMAHLLTYVPELRGKVQVIEEPVVVRDVRLSLRLDGQAVQRVYLAPARESLNFRISAEYVEVDVPEVCGYQLVVFE